METDKSKINEVKQIESTKEVNKISSNPVLSDSFCGAGNITNDRCYRLGYLCQNCEYFNPQNVR